ANDLGEKRHTMDWESFFTHYRKPGFIPGYEIVNKLGSGVFGEVYKARKESIGKFYAIKFLKISDEKVSEAIFKELESLRYFAQIDHPHLVSIEDQGEVMGIPYIVMGHAGDDTLKKRLKNGPLPLADAIAILSQICSGVAALHEKSIIHFDLKPANIFMKEDHARVGDYGLSKLVTESQMTMSIGRGTPYYMAPEMLTRKGDHRSDIYSLGTIIYEMVTGDVPFKGDSEWEVLKKHESEAVVIPGHVQEPFRSVILRCMAKEPDDRFQSVGELLEALTGSGTTMPPLARASAPVTPTSPLRRVMPPPLPNGKLLTGIKSRRVGRRVKKNLKGVIGQIRKAGGDVAAQGNLANPNKPLSGSFYSDFEDFDQGEAPASAPKPVKTFFLFRPIRAMFSAIGKGLSAFFTNFFRYAIVIAITVGLASLIHLALEGQLGS
ncbi:MAG: serine/threonine protein kinase, partial [Planctomycetota bacterium]